jgi:hypothetical protein
MSAKFPIFFGVALVLLGLFLWFSYSSTSDARLQVSGEILKVRSLEMTPDSTLVILDFRMKNESDVKFVLKEATILWTNAEGKESEATTVARPDMDRILQYAQQAGPKYNEMFVMREQLTAKAMLDRMAAGSVQVSDARFGQRKGLKLRLTDLDGQSFEFEERKKP